MPEELEEAWVLKGLGVPLATSWRDLQDVPSLLVEDWLIIAVGLQDAEEWDELDRQKRPVRAPTPDHFGG